MNVLHVAEKHDSAKTISKYLSRNPRLKFREGKSKFTKIYEWMAPFPNYDMKDCKMIMTSVCGHLLEYKFLDCPTRQGRPPPSLFDAPVVKRCKESSDDIKKSLEKEVKGCGALVIWTDCDREGENIGFEIIKVCQAVKPNIQVYRAKFSEITQISVDRALRTLGEPDKRQSDAVDVRSELDLRIGAAFIVEERTPKPNLLTEADLIALMDEKGIGTNSTRVGIIENIKKCVEVMNDKYLKPTKLGLGLIMGYDRMGLESITKPDLRKKLEDNLTLICEGKKKPAEVLNSTLVVYQNLLSTAFDKEEVFINTVDEFEALASSSPSRPSSGGATCDCRMPAKIGTTKNGPNKGLQFYRCHYFKHEGGKRCEFFDWADKRTD